MRRAPISRSSLAALAVVITIGVSIPPALASSSVRAELRVSSIAPPNVVVFMVDDLPAMDDRLLLRLPHIKRMFLDEGVRFTDMYVETPLCCPGRAGWLTGQHTSNHGVDRNDARLFHPDMTLATQLQAEGYHTALIGKYLNLYQLLAPTTPPGWDGFEALDPPGYYEYTVWSKGLATGKVHGKETADYSTDFIRRRAVRRLQAAPSDRPLFLWLAPFAAHGPYTAAPRHRIDPRCTGLPGWRPPSYNEFDVSDKPAYVRDEPLLATRALDLVAICRTMLAVDDLVGAVRTEIARQRRLGNTLFVFTSDHGMNAGAHRLLQKSTPYSTHVPFFVRWAQRLGTTPKTISERLSNIDFAPTICEIAGCEMGPYPDGQPGPDGRSFRSSLAGGSASLDRTVVLEAMPHGGMRGIPPWHAAATTAASPLASRGCLLAAEGGCRWQYVEYGTGETELYDLSNGPCWEWSKGEPGDPCRLGNLAGRGTHTEIESELAALLAELTPDDIP